MVYREKIKESVELIKKSSYIVAFTGAGISTESGIPDFRSTEGIWKKFRIVSYQEFLSDKNARIEFWKMAKELVKTILNAKPNEAHKALAEFEKMGILKYVITQNIDNLHQLAGSKNVIELHGNYKKLICLNCGKRYSVNDVLQKLENNEFDLRCDECKGIIKPEVVFFGEPLPEIELTLANKIATKCDLMFVIGSSLQVEPAASIPRLAYYKGAKLIFINKSSTEWDFMAKITFYEKASKVLKNILDELKN